MNVRVLVAERLHLEVLHLGARSRGAPEQHRDHDERPRLLGNPMLEIDPGETARAGETVHDHLDDPDRDLARRQQDDEGDPGEERGGAPKARATRTAAATPARVRSAIEPR